MCKLIIFSFYVIYFYQISDPGFGGAYDIADNGAAFL